MEKYKYIATKSPPRVSGSRGANWNLRSGPSLLSRGILRQSWEDCKEREMTELSDVTHSCPASLLNRPESQRMPIFPFFEVFQKFWLFVFCF